MIYLFPITCLNISPLHTKNTSVTSKTPLTYLHVLFVSTLDYYNQSRRTGMHNIIQIHTRPIRPIHTSNCDLVFSDVPEFSEGSTHDD